MNTKNHRQNKRQKEKEMNSYSWAVATPFDEILEVAEWVGVSSR